MDTPILNPSEPTKISDERVLHELAIKTAAAVDSLQAHILDLDLRLGGGQAGPALAALGALLESMKMHYVLERKIFNAKHYAKFECVPREIWDKCKREVEDHNSELADAINTASVEPEES